jgi:hypothetical protein
MQNLQYGQWHVFYMSDSRLHKKIHWVIVTVTPSGGGVEYLHRDPASRRRRQKGKSQIWDSKIWSWVQRALLIFTWGWIRLQSQCLTSTPFVVYASAFSLPSSSLWGWVLRDVSSWRHFLAVLLVVSPVEGDAQIGFSRQLSRPPLAPHPMRLFLVALVPPSMCVVVWTVEAWICSIGRFAEGPKFGVAGGSKYLYLKPNV